MNGRRHALRAARSTALLLASAGVLAACSGGSNAVQSGGDQNGYHFINADKKGTVIAPDKRQALGVISGSLLNGGTFTLSQDLGKVVVVNFWATWCSPCVTETPQFDSVYRADKSMGVTFVGIDTKESSRDAPRAFVKDNNISYPIVFDEPGQVAIEMGNIPLQGLPTTVLVDKHGKVAAVYIGPLSPKDLQPVLTTLSKET